MKLYADVILPLPLRLTYTYAVPDEFEGAAQVGSRVIVNLGVKKFYTGIIVKLHGNRPDVETVKAITTLLDDSPIVTDKQLTLWEFIASYYCCSIGDVFHQALPSSLQMKSEAYISINSEEASSGHDFTTDELTLLDRIADNKLYRLSEFNMAEIRIAKRLIEQGFIRYSEQITEKYHQLYTDYITLNSEYHNDERLNNLLNSLKRAKQQQQLIERYIALCTDENNRLQFRPIERTTLLKEANTATTTLKALTTKNILLVEKKKRFRTDVDDTETRPIHTLTPKQNEAYEQIKQQLNEKNTTLLHGVTASGKTEIYIKLIEEQIAQGKQVLMLIPEIGLTQELSHRLKLFFGNDMCVYHSRHNNQQRADIYRKMLSDNPYKIVIGVRSSIFLPFNNLGLIVIDEEHDMSYKQTDTAPRYNCRDVAIYLAHLHGAKTLMGSATPSIETYTNCQTGKYGLTTLSERYQGVPLPRIQIVDLSDCYKKRAINGHFSYEMINQINRTLQEKRQVILFQNRRGYSPYVECPQCAYVPHCPNCDVSLTYHRHTNTLRCHYCGYTQTMQHNCPECHEGQLSTRGFGTEQIEKEAMELFPEARIGRLDADTVRTLNSFDKILDNFRRGEIDIIIGTQIIAKGLHFDNVGIVGILNADNLLNAPDFRAYERAYQMIVQVAGRTGRSISQGKVVLQTSQPDNPLISHIVNNRYDLFFKTQMVERNTFHYPPYYRMITISVKDENECRCDQMAQQLSKSLKGIFGARILGPDIPLVGRIQNKYIRKITAKIELSASISRAKQLIINTIDSTLQGNTRTTATIDVDPM